MSFIDICYSNEFPHCLCLTRIASMHSHPRFDEVHDFETQRKHSTDRNIC